MKRSLIWMMVMITAVLLAFFLGSNDVPAKELTQSSPSIIVVRAYYTDKAMINTVTLWTEPWEVNRDENYIVLEATPAEIAQLEAIGFRVEMDEKLTVQYNTPRTMSPNQTSGIPNFACYRTVEETYTTAETIAVDYPHLATWTDIGDSWEKVTAGGNAGYDMMVLKLTNAAIPGPKPKLFIMTSVHAREYTPAELNTRFAEYLVANYGINADVTWMLDYNEIHLLLQANPDGRKKAETGMWWRKNTNQNYCGATSNSRGADLNRNYPFGWGVPNAGTSGSACADTYFGPSAASEPETEAVVDYVRTNYDDVRPDDLNVAAPITTTGIFLDIHSYSELVLWSWGDTFTHPPNHTELQTLGRKFAWFNKYEPDQSASLYLTSGTTDDFAYGELGLPAYTFELGTAFFQNCGTFESTILPDNLEALIYAAKVVRRPYMTPAGPDALDLNLSASGVAAGTAVTLTTTLNDTHYNNENGTEPVQNISAGQYSIDTPIWNEGVTAVALTAVDGNFNSSIETAYGVIDTTGLAEGRHIVYTRGQDADGNWGAVSAEFLYILDPATVPTAVFSTSTPDALGTATTFNNGSLGGLLSQQWDFGDGSNETAVNPTHTYATTGTFTVTLHVTNTLGTDSYTDTVRIMVGPTAVFTATSPITISDSITFTNQSLGDELTYVWNFGDGITSTVTAPVHLYAFAGTYDVTLTAANATGNDTIVQQITVTPAYRYLYLPIIVR